MKAKMGFVWNGDIISIIYDDPKKGDLIIQRSNKSGWDVLATAKWDGTKLTEHNLHTKKGLWRLEKFIREYRTGENDV